MIAQCSLHSFASDILGRDMKTNQLRTSGISPLSYISFIFHLSVPKSSKAVSIFIPISSSFIVLLLFLLTSAELISDFNATGYSTLLDIIDFSLLLSMYSFNPSSILCLSSKISINGFHMNSLKDREFHVLQSTRC